MKDQLKFDLLLFGAAIVATAAVLGADLDLSALLDDHLDFAVLFRTMAGFG